MANRFCGPKSLVWWTLLGVILGTGLGAALYNANCSPLTIELIGYLGKLYIRALQQLVLPLVIFALMSGVFSLRQTDQSVGRITRWSLIYYLISMILAVSLGISLVHFIKPGKSQPFSNRSSSTGKCSHDSSSSNSTNIAEIHSTQNATAIVEPLLDVGRNLIPTNIVQAAAEANYLGVITAAIIFGFCINTFGERAEPLIRLVEICNSVVVKIIFAVIKVTPVGVASLIASTLLKTCNIMHLMKALAVYVGIVLGGLFIHSIIVLPITVILLSRRNPFTALVKFMPALLMGLGTSSSAATMPVTMDCAEASGCDPSLVRFVIPFGTNVNRDGSALYEAVSVLFICQAHGLNLPIGKLFVLAIAATLAAIGCGSIPNAALVTMITALQAIGYSQFVDDIALLYALDWLLGSIRTSVNIWGDGCACLIVDEWAKRFPSDPEKQSSAPENTEATGASSV